MPSYTYFTNLYDLPYSIVAIVFIFTKLLLFIYKCICWCCKCYCRRQPQCPSCISCITKNYRKITCWMLRIFFANSEGFTELSENTENGNENTENGNENTENGNENTENGNENTENGNMDKNNAYINKVPIQNQDLPVFSVLLFCYSLLILLIMYSTYLLDISFTCSDDPGIYCFPELLDEDDPDNPSITEDVRESRITDCSEWTNSNVSDKVGFTCFRYALNAQEALAVGGGLLAIFTIVTRMTVSIMINLQTEMSSRFATFRKITYTILALFINLVVFPLIILVTFVNYSFDLSRTFDSDDVVQQVSDAVRDNGVQAIIILSTIELLLAINWDNYAKEKESNGQADIQLEETRT